LEPKYLWHRGGLRSDLLGEIISTARHPVTEAKEGRTGWGKENTERDRRGNEKREEKVRE